MRKSVAIVTAVGASALALASFATAQDDQQSSPDPGLEDVFADPQEPGEPEVESPTDVQALTPPAADAPADIPGPASELDGLGAPVETEAAPTSVAPGQSGRRGETVTLRALDKITARYQDLKIKIGERARYASLELLPRSCDKRPPEEFPETTAFVEIFDRDVARARTTATAGERPEADKKNTRPLDGVERNKPETGKGVGAEARIFSGWMFASSPGLSALDHPIYDVWVIDCKTVAASR